MSHPPRTHAIPTRRTSPASSAAPGNAKDGGFHTASARPLAGQIPALVCALLLSLAHLIGYVCSHAIEADGYALHWSSAPVTIAVVLALWAVFYLLLRALFSWFDRHSTAAVAPGPGAAAHSVTRPWRTLREDGFFARHCLVISAAVILVCWLPYLIVYLPGTLTYDGARSMNQFITDAPLENHHPVVMNMLYAGLMTLGRALRSDNAGLLLIMLFQTAACVLAFSFCVRQLVRMETPRWAVIATLAFYALFPGWGVFAQEIIKDTLFYAVFCAFVTTLVRLLRTRQPTRSQWVCLLLLALAVCFTRNNGIYIVVPTLAAVLLYQWRKSPRPAPTASAAPASAPSTLRGRSTPGPTPRKRNCTDAALVLVASTVTYLLVFNLAWPTLGINTHEDKETLSVPFQQTARCVLEHPDDVTDQEREAIDAILPYDQLADLYLPDLSDPVKEAVKTPSGALSAEQKSDYFSAWLSMGLRHPLTYVRATAANIYAYFYPWVIVGPEIERSPYTFKMASGEISEAFDVHYVQPDNVRDAMTAFVKGQLDIPVLKAIHSPALYVWVFLVLLAYAIHARKHTAWYVAVPLFMLVLSVLAGPLNGQIRYILPLAAALPQFAACVLVDDGRKHREGKPCLRPCVRK